MGMTQKHYNGLGEVVRQNLTYYENPSLQRDAVLRVCFDLGRWITSLEENPRFSEQQFVFHCSTAPNETDH